MHTLRCLVLVCLCWGSAGAKADWMLAEADEDTIKSELRQSHSSPRIGNKDAADRVKSEYPGTKVLSIKLIQGSGSAVYKVKTLSNGVIRSVYVDGNNGEVFE